MPARFPRLPIYVVAPVAAVLAVLLVVLLYYYRGGYNPPPSVDIPFEEFTQTTSATENTDFVDVPGVQISPGTLLVDTAHRNAFNEVEIATLLSRITARGYNVDFIGDFTLLDEEERHPIMEAALREADSLLVILPREPYSATEVTLLKRFVEKGGKLLLIADPTRPHDINSLAAPLGLEFQPDYLYNQTEYDLNFQNIFVRDFQPNELTMGLNEIVLYTAGSIKTSGSALANTDTNTESVLSGKDGPKHPLAFGENRNVLGIYDLTFQIPPQSSMSDNNQLISNIADFLTDVDREFELSDFPYFFQNDVDIVLGQSSLFDAGTAARAMLTDLGIHSEMRDQEDLAADTIFLGLYEDSSRVVQYLEANGVSVGESISITSAPEIPTEGTSLITLARSQDRHILVVLGDSPEALDNAIERLSSGEFRSGLADDFVGVYKTE